MFSNISSIDSITWDVPSHPVTVTRRIITLLVGNPGIHLHFPVLLGGGEVSQNWTYSLCLSYLIGRHTLQSTNISHLGKRKSIFTSTLGGDMLVPRRIYFLFYTKTGGLLFIFDQPGFPYSKNDSTTKAGLKNHWQW